MASIETPRELFVHKLGAALTMEETILEMLENLQEEASDAKLQRDLQQHHRETQQQIENLKRVFQALGEEPENMLLGDRQIQASVCCWVATAGIILSANF